MTIEERAEQATRAFSFRNGYQGPKEAYIDGAKSQRAIDYMNACKFLEGNYGEEITVDLVEKFKKAIWQ